MTVDRQYLSRASTAALTAFISSSGAFFVLLVTRDHYGSGFTITIGAVGTVFGLFSVAAAGFTVHTVMSTAREFRTMSKTPGSSEAMTAIRMVLSQESRAALTMTALALPVTGLLTAIGPQLFHVAPGYFYSYWLPYLPVLVLSPMVAILAGITRAAALDIFGLGMSMLRTGLTVASALIGVALGLEAHHALILIAVTTFVLQITAIILRLARLKHFGLHIVSTMVGAFSRHAIRRAKTSEFSPTPQFLTAIDGFVFMVTFTLAISVAANHSAAAGAMVALIVSFMRTAIVPAKQMGLVGGRMSKQGTVDLHTVQISAAVLTTAVALLALVLILAGVVPIAPATLAAMVVIQLASEPFGGILYSYLKVAGGPYTGLFALAISYLGIAIPGLLIIHFFGLGEPTAVWGCVFLARLVFSALTSLAARRWRGTNG